MMTVVQGTSLEINGKGVLIQGKSGIGKTTLALKLIDKGGKLISDDITNISLQNNDMLCEVQPKLYGKIELRGLGILQGMSVCPKAKLACIIKLLDKKTNRLPLQQKYETIFEKKVPVFEFFSCETSYLWVLYALKVLDGELTLLKDE